MGQKTNPILFRAGLKKEKFLPSYVSPLKKPYFSHLFSQELEFKKFLSSLLKSRGILVRSSTCHRTMEELSLSLDLYFTSLFFRESKLVWVRSFFKNMKIEYKNLKRVKDLKGFLEASQQGEEDREDDTFFLEKKKFLSGSKKRIKIFYPKYEKGKNFEVVYKRRLFYFYFFKKEKI